MNMLIFATGRYQEVLMVWNLMHLLRCKNLLSSWFSSPVMPFLGYGFLWFLKPRRCGTGKSWPSAVWMWGLCRTWGLLHPECLFLLADCGFIRPPGCWQQPARSSCQLSVRKRKLSLKLHMVIKSLSFLSLNIAMWTLMSECAGLAFQYSNTSLADLFFHSSSSLCIL